MGCADWLVNVGLEKSRQGTATPSFTFAVLVCSFWPKTEGLSGFAAVMARKFLFIGLLAIFLISGKCFYILLIHTCIESLNEISFWSTGRMADLPTKPRGSKHVDISMPARFGSWRGYSQAELSKHTPYLEPPAT